MPSEKTPPPSPPALNPWFRTAWRRGVVDMHIPDWDEKFFAQFDPNEYVDRLIQARAQSIVCYAQSHTGLFNYPTKVGDQHRGLKGRNIVAEMIERCHRQKIAVVIYISVIYDRWASDHDPDWRLRLHDGTDFGPDSRYGTVCPNSPYREYVRSWSREMAEQFDVEGFRFDMTYWPCVCYCPHCQKRWAAEVGGDIPRTVDWTDERWVAFQHKREEWLGDFAAICTRTVKQIRPHATVEHQASTFPSNWTLGAATPLAAQNDFLEGDFYGSSWQGAFVRKLLEDLTPNRPMGFETSLAVDLFDHTGGKSAELLEAKACAAIADGAAFIFIDGIDPVGTVNPHPHARMGRVFDRLLPYYPHLGGERVADIAIFYSLDSKFNHAGNGKPIGQADTSDAHTHSAMQASRWLIGNHLPFGVVTKKSLGKLSRHKVLVLPGINLMDEEEAAAIREYVRGGGALYASAGTSLVNRRGQKQKDFMLADVFGVSIENADWSPRVHYIAPTAGGSVFFDENFDAKYPVFAKGCGMEVRAHAGAEVLATTTGIWPAPDPRSFSSIHSNPPWEPTGRPEIVFHRYGKGRVIYCATPIEDMDAMKHTFIRLIRHLSPDYRFEATAPASVEATLFHQPDRQRYIFSLINFQAELPNIPVHDIEVRLRLPGMGTVRELPSEKPVVCRREGDCLCFTVARLETLAMFGVYGA